NRKWKFGPKRSRLDYAIATGALRQSRSAVMLHWSYVLPSSIWGLLATAKVWLAGSTSRREPTKTCESALSWHHSQPCGLLSPAIRTHRTSRTSGDGFSLEECLMRSYRETRSTG